MATAPNKPRRYHIRTMGCQMNEHDSEKMAGLLEAMGYEPTERPEDADVLLFNTCSVRENPERRLYGQVGSLRSLKERKPGMVIGICGCMTQQKTERERIEEQLKHVDLVFGTHNLHRLPELLNRAQQGEHPVVEVWDDPGEMIVEDLPVHRESDLKAFVTIMYGCDKHCTYCIVPYVRGRERSRDPEKILAEVRELAERGTKEVTLLGQNVNAYGKDRPSGIGFADLLLAVNDVPGLKRVRFTTSHPKDVDRGMIEAMRDGDKICEHLHLPVQSGSSRVLKRMGRRYNRDEYLALVDEFRREIPEIAITTDIIVGFPGETDEDFEDTLSLVERVGYDAAFTFIYSPRTGTPATRLVDQVPEPVKKERIYQLIELQERIGLARNEALVGTVQEVLLEGPSENNPAVLAGRTRTNKLVHFEGDSLLVGELAPVRIERVHAHTLHGRRVEKP